MHNWFDGCRKPMRDVEKQIKKDKKKEVYKESKDPRDDYYFCYWEDYKD